MTIGKHRLCAVMPNGLRWSQPASGVVFVSTLGEVISVERGPVGSTGRSVDTGQVWEAEQAISRWDEDIEAGAIGGTR